MTADRTQETTVISLPSRVVNKASASAINEALARLPEMTGSTRTEKAKVIFGENSPLTLEQRAMLASQVLVAATRLLEQVPEAAAVLWAGSTTDPNKTPGRRSDIDLVLVTYNRHDASYVNRRMGGAWEWKEKLLNHASEGLNLPFPLNFGPDAVSLDQLKDVRERPYLTGLVNKNTRWYPRYGIEPVVDEVKKLYANQEPEF